MSYRKLKYEQATLKTSKKASMQTVADIAGISVMTVSRALSENGACSEDTRKRILEIAAQIGYMPNRLGKGLTKNRIDTVGIIVPNIIHSFFAALVYELEELLAAAGLNMFLCCSHDNPDIEAKKAQMLLEYRVSGIVLVPSLRSGASAETARRLSESGIPLVMADRIISGIKADTVEWESRKAMKLLVETLAKAGRKNFAYIAGEKNEWNKRGRTLGFWDGISSSGARCVAEINCPMECADAAEYIKPLFSSRTPHPDAICCATDIHADKVLYALKKIGVKIPSKTALTGFGGIINSHNTKLSVTTVRQNPSLMAKNTAELVLARIRNTNQRIKPDKFKHIKLPVSIEFGQSTQSKKNIV